jgi:hypothetical protein
MKGNGIPFLLGILLLCSVEIGNATPAYEFLIPESIGIKAELQQTLHTIKHNRLREEEKNVGFSESMEINQSYLQSWMDISKYLASDYEFKVDLKQTVVEIEPGDYVSTESAILNGLKRIYQNIPDCYQSFLNNEAQRISIDEIINGDYKKYYPTDTGFHLMKIAGEIALERGELTKHYKLWSLAADLHPEKALPDIPDLRLKQEVLSCKISESHARAFVLSDILEHKNNYQLKKLSRDQDQKSFPLLLSNALIVNNQIVYITQNLQGSKLELVYMSLDNPSLLHKRLLMEQRGLNGFLDKAAGLKDRKLVSVNDEFVYLTDNFVFILDNEFNLNRILDLSKKTLPKKYKGLISTSLEDEILQKEEPCPIDYAHTYSTIESHITSSHWGRTILRVLRTINEPESIEILFSILNGDNSKAVLHRTAIYSLYRMGAISQTEYSSLCHDPDVVRSRGMSGPNDGCQLNPFRIQDDIVVMPP